MNEQAPGQDCISTISRTSPSRCSPDWRCCLRLRLRRPAMAADQAIIDRKEGLRMIKHKSRRYAELDDGGTRSVKSVL
ncbi:Os05g0125900 [Oryza sativa Japonica Group]|nr:unknown protein [Oryza sativa Japonica Group]AAT39233.1 unknown protein [Oryza sativa Japonica Group]BAF16437.1 Os05g0125900 [Oryza sativa Japonica Group]|eukprot:NP_001054523.1 Os05g0125900 [Oryza sativa Japonica Group]